MMKKVILFICILLASQLSFANEEISEGLKQTAWNSIRAKFLGEESKELILYQYEIAIKLKGNYNEADSLCMAELINDLEKILPHKNIFLTSTVSNLDFIFNEPGVIRSEKIKNEFGRIKTREIKLTIPDDPIARKKTLYYNLYRSLVTFSKSPNESSTIHGCVFDEDSPLKITFHPADKFILKKLYSPNFYKEFKENYRKQVGEIEYKKFMYSRLLKISGNIGGGVLALLFISILIMLRFFKHHNWDIRKFILQSVCGILALDIYFIFNETVQNLNFQTKIIGYLLPLNLTIFLITLIFYYIEKLISNSKISRKSKTILKLINTLIILSTFSYLGIGRLLLISSITERLMLTGVLTLTITAIRFFLLSLSEISNNEIRKKDMELLRINELHKQAELQSLQSKINPHFLYNALNSIASLSTVDGKKTEKMALALSDFFKYSLNKEQKEMVSLKEEIESVETYLTIEKVRFGDRLNFAIQLPEELKNIIIPQFIIQPLIENAVKHGISKIVETGEIRLVVSAKNNNLEVRVFDNGPAISNEPISGYGLQSIQEKLNLIYGNKAYMSWNNEPEKYVLISLPLNDKS